MKPIFLKSSYRLINIYYEEINIFFHFLQIMVVRFLLSDWFIKRFYFLSAFTREK